MYQGDAIHVIVGTPREIFGQEAKRDADLNWDYRNQFGPESDSRERCS